MDTEYQSELLRMRKIQKFPLYVFTCLFLASCGTVPVPGKKGRPVLAPKQEPAKVEQKVTAPVETKPSAEIEEHKPSVKPPVVKPLEETKPLPPVDMLTAGEHVQNAINFLQVGKEDQARAELTAALAKEPQNSMASNLLEQVNANPQAYFAGMGSFAYTIRSGDSLSSIAKKFLDDPLKFYILAKYNDMDNPSKLRRGETIRVPGKAPMPTPPSTLAKPPHKAEPSDSEIQYSLAKRYYDAGKYQDAIDLLEKSVQERPKDLKARDLLVLSYTRYAEKLAEKANLLEAQTVLEKALSMQPRNKKLRQQLKHLENQREADRLYQSGVEALQAGKEDKAFEDFNKVLDLDPNHALAKKQILSLKSDIIDEYHKQAMQLYRKQKLDAAIAIWDKVLALDPDHELARLYRARAIELKERLKKLEGK
jgi:tetratricopeptide (TPR) repeat protein